MIVILKLNYLECLSGCSCVTRASKGIQMLMMLSFKHMLVYAFAFYIGPVTSSCTTY